MESDKLSLITVGVVNNVFAIRCKSTISINILSERIRIWRME